MGGWFLQVGASTGVWWRYDFSAQVRSRFREKISGRDDLSINVLELLDMIVGAWIFIVQADTKPAYARDSIRIEIPTWGPSM